jgi:hypothetical protein
MKRQAKKRQSKKRDIPRPYAGGEWTASRFRSFVMSALRGARWPVKYAAINAAFVTYGINPKTGRKCKLHRCAHCKQLFPQSKVQADHINPIVPVTGFDSWDDVIRRNFCEIDGYQVLCGDCHLVKTNQEKALRLEHQSKQ